MEGRPTTQIDVEPWEPWHKWCRDYYDLEIFSVNGDFEILVWSELWKSNLPAGRVDFAILARELQAVNAELFGLAWCSNVHRLALSKELEGGRADVVLCVEILFAQRCLEAMGDGEIWRAAGVYNDTMMKAAMDQASSMQWSIPRDIPAYYERGMMCSAGKEQDQLLENLRTRYVKLLPDNECLTRVLTRLMSMARWADGVMIQQRLCVVLAQRLALASSLETLFFLQRVIDGLYRNASNYIELVQDYGSWDEARKASDVILQRIIHSVKGDEGKAELAP